MGMVDFYVSLPEGKWDPMFLGEDMEKTWCRGIFYGNFWGICLHKKSAFVWGVGDVGVI